MAMAASRAAAARNFTFLITILRKFHAKMGRFCPIRPPSYVVSGKKCGKMVTAANFPPFFDA
jgi:hypothetical protein